MYKIQFQCGNHAQLTLSQVVRMNATNYDGFLNTIGVVLAHVPHVPMTKVENASENGQT